MPNELLHNNSLLWTTQYSISFAIDLRTVIKMHYTKLTKGKRIFRAINNLEHLWLQHLFNLSVNEVFLKIFVKYRSKYLYY